MHQHLMMKSILLTLAASLTLSAIGSAADKPLNILVLYADDWRHDTLGVAGNPVVKTPNIDRLAGQGYRFTQNCVTTAICGVSRASIYTGQWMSRHGCKGFKAFQTPWDETYPGLLKDNGYYLGHVGKWHNGPYPKKHYDFARFYHGKHWYETETGEKIHVTQRNERDALEFFDKMPDDKPFCLTVAFFATHAQDGHPKQFLPQPESMELYKDVKIPVPVNATEESWNRLPKFFNEKNEGRNRWHWRFDTPEKFQTMMKNYYRLATEVDSTCGRILAELEKRGLRENTLVIFTTDNGYYHAEHGLADKWYPHQESIRVPLIIDDPRMADSKKGETNEEFTLNVDLAPTILSAAGIDAPKAMQGRDIAPLYLGGVKEPWRSEFFYEHPTLQKASFIPASEALVRKDYKYFYWPEQDVEQLFNIQKDPHEENDLVNDPEHQQVLVEMRKRFKELKAGAR
ncbi:sulfatase [Verrucomicrobiaceae bacterium R5-34]|nr:sulfatase [Verrucomicrobiaceae bacterium R5-34]